MIVGFDVARTGVASVYVIPRFCHQVKRLLFGADIGF